MSTTTTTTTPIPQANGSLLRMLESAVALSEPTPGREPETQNTEISREDDNASDTNRLKRRASVVSDAESEGKRRRLSNDRDTTTHHTAEESIDGRRNAGIASPEKSDQKSFGDVKAQSRPSPSEMGGSIAQRRRATDKPADSKVEERKRGRRLFGALLGTLSGTDGPGEGGRRRASEGTRKFSRASRDAQSPATPLKSKDDIMAERKRDQIVYTRQAVCFGHVISANMG